MDPAPQISTCYNRFNTTINPDELIKNKLEKDFFPLFKYAESENRTLINGSGINIRNAVPFIKRLNLTAVNLETDGLENFVSNDGKCTPLSKPVVIRGTYFLTDKDITLIVLNCPNLRKISLKKQKYLTIHALKHLKNLPLTNLNIVGCENLYPNNALKVLKKFPLNTLVLGSCRLFTNDKMIYLKDLHSLTSLDLSFCMKLTSGLSHLKNLPLTSLSLRGCKKLPDNELANLSRLNLTSLSLSFCEGLTDNGLAHIQNMTTLIHLDLSGGRECADSSLTAAGLAHVTELTNLTYLDITGLRTSDSKKEVTYSNLPKLYLTSDPVANFYLKELINLKHLELDYYYSDSSET